MDMGVPAADQNQILSNCNRLPHRATMPEHCMEDEQDAGLLGGGARMR
jgi:hypothetical protein